MRLARARGSAAVELALVLPLVLFAALALVQVGLFGKDALLVAQAAREGAREAAVTTDESRVRDSVIRGGGLAEDRAEVEIERSGGAGDPVTVLVRYRSVVVVPLVEWLFPEEITLSASATMRQETDEA